MQTSSGEGMTIRAFGHRNQWIDIREAHQAQRNGFTAFVSLAMRLMQLQHLRMHRLGHTFGNILYRA